MLNMYLQYITVSFIITGRSVQVGYNNIYIKRTVELVVVSYNVSNDNQLSRGIFWDRKSLYE